MAMTNEELELKIQRFFEIWDFDELNEFARLVIEFINIFELDKEMDWDKEVLSNEDVRNVKIIRCMFIMLKLSDVYAGKMLSTKAEFKSLWRKLNELSG